MEFCSLEKSQETYIHFQKYYHAIKNNQHLLKIENELQCAAIYEHLMQNQLCPDDTQEKINWIKIYSADFRCYLNTLRRLAEHCQFIVNMSLLQESSLDKELFFQFVETWNKKAKTD